MAHNKELGLHVWVLDTVVGTGLCCYRTCYIGIVFGGDGHVGLRAAAAVPNYGYGWPQRVGLYAKQGELMWAHLGRGTSFRPRGPWRERLRHLAAWAGSPRARKILSYQEDRAAFLRKGWEIVRAR